MAQVWENSRHRTGALLVLLAIADYADDQGFAFPSVEALKRKARMTERNVYRALARLTASGELEIIETSDGRRTTRYCVVPPAGEQLTAFGPKRKGPKGTPDKKSPLTQMRLTPDKNDTPPLTKQPGVTISDPPEESPMVPRAASGANLLREIQREHKAQLREAHDLWIAGRRKANLSRFTDNRALAGLRTAISRVLAEGAEWRDVVRGLECHYDDPKSSPWYADQWAREARYEREERERFEVALAKRRAEEMAPPTKGLHQLPRFDA